MNKKIAAAAILMCAVMVLVAGAPLVMADTHHIVKGAQGPRASAVSWMYTPTDTGLWSGHIVNSGLRSLVVDVNDVTSGAAMSILHQRIRFAAYPTNTLDTLNATMAKGHVYNITATPNGAKGTFCDVSDQFVIPLPPVASFVPTVSGATVSVDGSASSDPNVGASIKSWGWEWGDGTTGSGMMASHTYTVSKTYTIVLTVLSSTGLTASVSHDVVVVVPVQDLFPVAAFTASAVSWTVSVDASASTDDHGIASYDWNWGDGSAHGSGVTATHTYAASNTYTITLTVTDTAGQSTPLAKQVPVIDNPPVAAFTASAHSWTLTVDASASTDDYGIVSYDWNWGDGSAHGSGSVSAHTYTASATYTVTLTVKDTVGQNGVLAKQVPVIDNPPVAAFTVSATGWSVTVTSTSSDDFGIASYDWNWGTAAPHSSGPTATHTYTASGSPPVPYAGVSAIPLPPFLLYGYTKDTAGLPLINCVVTITNQRTLDSVQVLSDDGIIIGDPGFYSFDLSGMTNGYAAGDVMTIAATSPAGATGSTTGTLGTDPYLQVDVTLTGGQVNSITVTITLTVTDSVGQVGTTSQTLTLTK